MIRTVDGSLMSRSRSRGLTPLYSHSHLMLSLGVI